MTLADSPAGEIVFIDANIFIFYLRPDPVLGSACDQFLKRVESSGLRVRDVEAVLSKGLLEKVDQSLAKSGNTAQQLYEVLTVSDQAQLREFYLSKIEEIEPALRAKFQKLYSYY